MAAVVEMEMEIGWRCGTAVMLSAAMGVVATADGFADWCCAPLLIPKRRPLIVDGFCRREAAAESGGVDEVRGCTPEKLPRSP